MDWLEIIIHTAPGGMDALATALTAAGFEDLVLEDQAELEEFLEQNRVYWDYIDEKLQQQLEGISQIRLYVEKDDAAALEKKNETQLRQKVRQAEKKIEKARTDIQRESKRLSEQIAKKFANRLMKKGDLDE